MSTGFSNALDIFLAHAATFEPVFVCGFCDRRGSAACRPGSSQSPIEKITSVVLGAALEAGRAQAFLLSGWVDLSHRLPFAREIRR
jgi:hypothetical protein